MRLLAISLCAFSFVASLVALAHHLGFDLWGCASCSYVNELPLSPILAWGGPLVLAALTYGLYADWKGVKIGLSVAALGSIALSAWMLNHLVVCQACILVHIGVISAALSLLPRAGFVGALLFSLAIVFTATDGWDRFTSTQGIGIFRPRPGEQIPDGRVFVLFTDPECSRCQMVEAKIATSPNRGNILHRWCLLPHSMYRSIRAATLLEMARMRSLDSFNRLRGILSQTQPPLTDKTLVEAARRAGLGDEAAKWLSAPADAALNVVDDDQTTSRELEIQSLPALAELMPPDVTGVRTLRLVPFTAIGIQP